MEELMITWCGRRVAPNLETGLTAERIQRRKAQRFPNDSRTLYLGGGTTDHKDDLWFACLFCEGCRNNWFTYWFRQKDQIPLHWRHRLSVPTCPWCSDTALQPPPEQVRTSRWPPNPYLQEYLAKH